jgi:hypothetical protein
MSVLLYVVDIYHMFVCVCVCVCITHSDPVEKSSVRTSASQPLYQKLKIVKSYVHYISALYGTYM